MPANGAWTSDASPSAQVLVRTRSLICPRNMDLKLSELKTKSTMQKVKISKHMSYTNFGEKASSSIALNWLPLSLTTTLGLSKHRKTLCSKYSCIFLEVNCFSGHSQWYLQKCLFVPNRSRQFWVTPRDKGVMSTCRWHGTLCWQDDSVAAMVTMVTAMPDHRRCGTALRLS